MRQVPNALSLLRLVLSPYVLLTAQRGDHLLSGVLFFLLAISDALDGFLARVLRAETLMGKLLDPVADKVLILFGLVSVVYFLDTGVNPYLLHLLVMRDVTLVIGSLLLMRWGFVPNPSLFGKLTTVMVSFTVSLAYLRLFLDIPWMGQVFNLVYTLSMVLVVVSWVDYTIKGVRYVTDKLIMEKR